MSRTTIDFSKHEITETKYPGVLIHKFALPHTIRNSVTFINTCGVMTVTGDFGNWVFCREFHPSPNGKVSDTYWDEKLRGSSESQTSHEYCPKTTLELIEEFVNEFENDFGRVPNEKETEWLDDLKYYVDDKLEYEYTAYRESPIDIDFEDIPYGKARHVWLNAVYDAFDSMCQKLNENG